MQAGKAVGYVALQEQVIPELLQERINRDGSRTFCDARIGVELFGHPTAPSRLLDATKRHPTAASAIKKVAVEPGYAAEEGTKEKSKRYPLARGKTVIGCSLETWGRSSNALDNVLSDLHGLAQRRQRDRGTSPTNWLLSWKALISIRVAMNTGRSIFDSVLNKDKSNLFYSRLSHPVGTDSCFLEDSNGDPFLIEDPYPGSGRLHTSTLDASGGQGECCTGGEDRA